VALREPRDHGNDRGWAGVLHNETFELMSESEESERGAYPNLLHAAAVSPSCWAASQEPGARELLAKLGSQAYPASQSWSKPRALARPRRCARRCARRSPDKITGRSAPCTATSNF
jgi:hypothetical protein